MKELYSSPELGLLCLTAQERLANDGEEIDFDTLLEGSNGGNAVKPADTGNDGPLIGL